MSDFIHALALALMPWRSLSLSAPIKARGIAPISHSLCSALCSALHCINICHLYVENQELGKQFP